MSARMAWRTKSSKPEGPKASQKGHKLEVGAQRAPRLLVPHICHRYHGWYPQRKENNMTQMWGNLKFFPRRGENSDFSTILGKFLLHIRKISPKKTDPGGKITFCNYCMVSGIALWTCSLNVIVFASVIVQYTELSAGQQKIQRYLGNLLIFLFFPDLLGFLPDVFSWNCWIFSWNFWISSFHGWMCNNTVRDESWWWYHWWLSFLVKMSNWRNGFNKEFIFWKYQ